jgi:hypothetical protein
MTTCFIHKHLNMKNGLRIEVMLNQNHLIKILVSNSGECITSQYYITLTLCSADKVRINTQLMKHSY